VAESHRDTRYFAIDNTDHASHKRASIIGLTRQ
jgi:hypothetical protein